MKAIFRILFAFCIGWFGYKAIEQAYEPYFLGLLSFLQFIPFTILIISIAFTVIIDTSYFKKSRSVLQFSMTFIGMVVFCIVIFKYVKDNIIRSSKTLVHVSHFAGATYVWEFEFKVNGRFRMIAHSMLGPTIYSGKYIMKDSTIKIESHDYDNLNFPVKGFIRNDTLHWDNFENMKVDKLVSNP